MLSSIKTSFFPYFCSIKIYSLIQPLDAELILIRITGEDRPGPAASVTEMLAEYDATILDVGQADIHNTLSLGIPLGSEEGHSGFIIKELLFKAPLLGVTIRFEPIGTDQCENWVGIQRKNCYTLTVLGRKLPARQISATTRVLTEQDLNIDAIERLTGRIPLDEDKTDTHTRTCIEFSVRGTPKDRIAVQERLVQLVGEQEMDFSFQQDNIYRCMRRLICFDMDSTLIKTEIVNELIIRAGVGDEVKAVTKSTIRGEIDFTESFTRRVALLKELDESVVQEITGSLPITEGVDRLTYVLRRCGYKITVLSGGFTYFGQYLQKKYSIDYMYANELEVVNGKSAGCYLGDIVDGKREAELLRLIAQVEKVDIAQTIAVEDGADDLPVLGVAGLGIAFHTEPKVVTNTKQSINIIGFGEVLYFLGFKDSYLNT